MEKKSDAVCVCTPEILFEILIFLKKNFFLFFPKKYFKYFQKKTMKNYDIKHSQNFATLIFQQTSIVVILLLVTSWL